MENPLLLFPQLNVSAAEDKGHYRAMRSAVREEPQKANKPGAKQKRNRLSLLLQRPEFHEGDHLGKPGSLTKAASVSPEEAVKWGKSFDKLLSEKAGLDAFTKFLKTEFSEENIEFWIACEDYKKSKSAQELLPKAKTIFETFIQKDAPKEFCRVPVIHLRRLSESHHWRRTHRFHHLITRCGGTNNKIKRIKRNRQGAAAVADGTCVVPS
ncbi:PREDICTED: regulator of G-protein signaling 18 isoform X2 [Pseudopodoces humilis]|uniref:regulator of G-protein signaling 18 isoform X2 n=1 Tax=Pseudopodoces humilis TaxID=181119 RepID=UPI0006B7F9E3|nr:PREDICTED: regulator of G-protein signaling 18 isoform X2 [Pseudopodoces humilis]